MKDNGKIRIEVREDILYVDIYHEGEIQLYDVIWINQTLRCLNQLHNHHAKLPLFLPEELIIDGTGSYSFSENAYLYLGEMMSDCKRIAFVTHSYHQDVVTDLIKSSYFAVQCIERFAAVTEAVSWLKSVQNLPQEAVSMGSVS